MTETQKTDATDDETNLEFQRRIYHSQTRNRGSVSLGMVGAMTISYSLQQLIEILSQTFEQEIVPEVSEFSIQEAAAILNVGPDFVNKLIEQGKISYRNRGSRKVICKDELSTFKKEFEKKCSKSLEELILMDAELI